MFKKIKKHSVKIQNKKFVWLLTVFCYLSFWVLWIAIIPYLFSSTLSSILLLLPFDRVANIYGAFILMLCLITYILYLVYLYKTWKKVPKFVRSIMKQNENITEEVWSDFSLVTITFFLVYQALGLFIYTWSFWASFPVMSTLSNISNIECLTTGSSHEGYNVLKPCKDTLTVSIKWLGSIGLTYSLSIRDGRSVDLQDSLWNIRKNEYIVSLLSTKERVIGDSRFIDITEKEIEKDITPKLLSLTVKQLLEKKNDFHWTIVVKWFTIDYKILSYGFTMSSPDESDFTLYKR